MTKPSPDSVMQSEGASMSYLDQPHADISISVPLIIGGVEGPDMECGITVFDDGGNIAIARYWMEGAKRDEYGRIITERKPYKNKFFTGHKSFETPLLPSSQRKGEAAFKPDIADFLCDMIADAFDKDDDAQERAADALNEAARDHKEGLADYRRDLMMDAAE